MTDAIRNDGEINDPKLAALRTFTRSLVVSRGRPSQDAVSAFLQVGYTEVHILDIILAISVKTISNYSNHIFNTPVDAAFSAWIWGARNAA